ALRVAELVLTPGSSASLQALLLLTVYALFDPRYLSPWYLVGVTSRAMADLGLHQDPTKS
ncbi:hypothetical protein MMC25_006546, partial [Agyrium rufum]|nr:hypothetical protein [Agyrium rufum]